MVCFLADSTIVADDIIPEKGAKYLFKTWQYDISNGKYVGKIHHRKIIYNKLGEDYNGVYLYENSSSKIKKVKMQVLSQTGKVLYTKEKKHFNKACGYGSFGGYDDDCTYYLDDGASQFPYIIDYEYTIECKSLFFLQGATFQHYIPVDSVSFLINNSDNTFIRSKIYGSDVQPIVSYYDGITSYHWILNNIPALESIKYLPPDAREEIHLSLVCEQLSFSGYTLSEVSWNGIGQWYNQLYQNKCNTKPLQDSLSIEEIYNNVIENVRYVAIQIGVGGWQPYDAALTESRAFGDCKDMSTLLISRLKNQNIKAYPVLVLTRDNSRIDRDFPNLRFNHVITVTIDGEDTTWMDPTCNSCVYGELPLMDEDIDVLVITEEGGVLRRTPASKPEDNQILRNTSLMISSDKYVDISCQIKFFGDKARYMRGRLEDKTKNEKKEYLENYINGHESLFSLQSFSFKNMDDINEPFIMHIKAKGKKKIDKIGKKWYINPYLFFREKNITKVKTEDRKYPIKFSYPNRIIDSIVIKIDTLLHVDSVHFIKPDSIETSFNFFTTYGKQVDNSFYCIVTKGLKTYQVNQDQFLEYELYYQRMKKITSKHIKLYTH